MEESQLISKAGCDSAYSVFAERRGEIGGNNRVYQAVKEQGLAYKRGNNAIASLLPGSNPEAIALTIYQKLQDYLRPGNLP